MTDIPPVPDDWQRILREGDKADFERLADPFTERMLRSARHDLDYYIDQGRLHESDLTAEEVVGEALIHAWDHRAQRPAEMSLQGWLLGTQYRVVRGLVEANQDYRRDKTLSLDQTVTEKVGDEDPQEWFADWYEPDVTLETMVPSQTPVDLEPALETDDTHRALDPTSYHVAMMHDEFDMDLPEVAFVMNQSLKETSDVLSRVRVTQEAEQEAGPPADNAPASPEEAEA